MLIVVEILLVAGLIGLVVSYLFRGRREAERQDVIDRRVGAYMQTIRREGGATELSAMSDTELRDVLLSSARNLRVQSERRWYALAGAVLVTVIAAIVVGSQNGVQGFGIALVVGAAAVWGLNEFLGRRMREPLEARGIDVERLRVE